MDTGIFFPLTQQQEQGAVTKIDWGESQDS